MIDRWSDRGPLTLTLQALAGDAVEEAVAHVAPLQGGEAVLSHVVIRGSSTCMGRERERASHTQCTLG